MSIWQCALIVIVCVAAAVTIMLLVRRRAPVGSWFTDGDRASGVFGVLATGFAVLLGLVVVLAFTSFDDSRSGAEAEAMTVTQQFETAQYLPEPARSQLGGDLVCYSRYVVHQSWPRMTDGHQGDRVNPWGVRMFKTVHSLEPETNSEQAAYGKWLDQTTDRESARNDRLHGAEGVIPTPLWVVLLLSAAVIFWFMLLFADSGEPWFVQATLMGSVVAVVVSSLLLISVLDDPFRDGVGGLQPVAMQRSLRMLDTERALEDEDGRPVLADEEIPCNDVGLPAQ